MSRRSIARALALITATSVISACGDSDEVRAAPKLGAELVKLDSATAARRASLEPGMLATVQAVPVKGFKGPGGKPFEVALRSAVPEAGHTRQFGTIALPVALRSRSASVNQYPCSSCHAGRTVTMAAQRIGDAHQNIKALHPVRVGAVCSTCHASENVAQLVLKNGDRAPVDESYRLCAECHFKQAEAWAGGGHGKRLDGWQGRRVVMSCADCHDPHDPAVHSRVPFRAPQLERNRSLTP